MAFLPPIRARDELIGRHPSEILPTRSPSSTGAGCKNPAETEANSLDLAVLSTDVRQKIPQKTATGNLRLAVLTTGAERENFPKTGYRRTGLLPFSGGDNQTLFHLTRAIEYK